MKNNYTYPARIRKKQQEIFLEFVDFPDAFASAENEEELIETAQEVLALMLLELLDQGKEPPKPSIITEGAVYIQVWLPYYKNKVKEVYVKKTVTIPRWLDILAKEKHINFSFCLVKGIKEELGIS